MSCHDTDTLVELSKILGHDAQAALLHLSECEECMNALVASAGVRSALAQGHDVRAGFTNTVLGSIPFVESPKSSRFWTVLEPILASVTVLAATAAASTSAPLAFNANTLVVAGLAGLAATLLLRSSPIRQLV